MRAPGTAGTLAASWNATSAAATTATARAPCARLFHGGHAQGASAISPTRPESPTRMRCAVCVPSHWTTTRLKSSAPTMAPTVLAA